MTQSCERCGSPDAKKSTFGDETYYLCKHCRDTVSEIMNGVAVLYIHKQADAVIGFKTKEIPELKRLFAMSADENIRKLIKFLNEVESDGESE